MVLSSYLAGSLSLALAAAAAVAPNGKRHDVDASKGLKMDFEVLVGNSLYDASPEKKPQRYKRADGQGYEMANAAGYYQAVVHVGSNKDECKVVLDTGSSYFWVMGQYVQCEEASIWSEYPLYVDVKRDAGPPPHLGIRGVTPIEAKLVDDVGIYYTVIPGTTIGGLVMPDYTMQIPGPAGGNRSDADSTAEIPEPTIGGGGYDGPNYTVIPGTTIGGFVMPDHTMEIPGSGNGGVGTRTTAVSESTTSAAGYTPRRTFGRNGTATRTTKTPYGGPSSWSNGASSCVELGSFRTGESDTFHVNNTAPKFYIQYADFNSATGLWGSDTVSMGNMSLEMSFGVVYEASLNNGVFGIGPYAANDPFNSSSNNFLTQLKERGIINTAAYSLYSHSKSSGKGSVLFGAVDHNKYTGQLQTVPMVSHYSDDDTINHFAITLNSLSLQSTEQNVTVLKEPIAALFGSASMISAVPTDLYYALLTSFGVDVSDDYGSYAVACSYRKTKGDVVFNFSGVQIKVPVGDFVIEQDGECFLGVESMSTTPNQYKYAILGQNVLQHAYVVFDMEAEEVSLAPVNYNEDEDVEAISDTVPSAVRVQDYSSTSLSSDISMSSAAKFNSGASRGYSPTMALAFVVGMFCCGAML